MLLVAKIGNYLGDRGTDHHADAVLLPPRAHFQSLIHHQIHEGIKPTQDSLDVSASIQLHCTRATLSQVLMCLTLTNVRSNSSVQVG